MKHPPLWRMFFVIPQSIATFDLISIMKRLLPTFLLPIILISFTYLPVLSQNTVGTLVNTPDAYDGFTLFTANYDTYLINNCGQVINQWTSDNLPGRSVYLLPDGSLLRAENIPNEFLSIPGMGGKLTLRDWDNNLIWEYQFSDENILQHHDFYPMENGNILVLMLENKSVEEAIQEGRNPDLLIADGLYNEKILEIELVGSNDINVVWEWNFWDHLVQEFDPTKHNYASVAKNPQRLDINFLGFSNGNNNWLHVNSVQYNKSLDQIIISSRQLNEFYIIDHSTTKEEAASDSGGRYDLGGDFLYRWGNPIAYKTGEESDRKLFGQHFPHWIGNGLKDAGKIILFNNGFQRTTNYSSIDILTPPINPDGSYKLNVGEAYGPGEFDWTYVDPVDPANFYSRVLSGAQRLPNGNTLICEGTSALFFEINENFETVWKYQSPAALPDPLSQGAPVDAVEALFRATKYSKNYPAFVGRDLTPGDPIEQDFNLDQCQVLSVPQLVDTERIRFQNPVQDQLKIETNLIVEKVELYNLQGQKILVANQEKNINFTYIPSGMYFIKIFTDQGLLSKKIIKA